MPSDANPNSNTPANDAASIASSSATLVNKDQGKKKQAEIDAKKLQEQALKSQIKFQM